MSPWEVKDLLQLCALAGVSPLDELTPKEVYLMAAHAEDMKWMHTSRVVSTMKNLVSKKPVPWQEDHPFRAVPKSEGTGLSIAQFSEKVKALYGP